MIAIAFHLNPIWIAGTALWQFALAHAIWLVLALVIAACVLWPGPMLAFARSRAGLAVGCAALAFAAGWEGRAFLDNSIALRRGLEAQIAATRAEAAKTQAALAAAAEQRREAETQRGVADAAAARAVAAQGETDHLQEQIRAYKDTLAEDAAAHPHADRRARCALSAADARGLLSIGSTSGRRKP